MTAEKHLPTGLKLPERTEDTDYYFEVISGTTTDNNDGEYYTFRSAQFGIGVPYTLYGQLTDGESASAVAGAIVEVSLLRSQSVSSHLTVLTDESGFWLTWVISKMRGLVVSSTTLVVTRFGWLAKRQSSKGGRRRCRWVIQAAKSRCLSNFIGTN